MRRREFFTLLGGAAAWPVGAHAQQPVMPMIGFLHSQSPDLYLPMVAAFREGLRESGYVEGRNVAVEYRWAKNQTDRLKPLASDLVRRAVAVIFAAGGVNPALAAKAASSTIPIVFANGSDPVKLGLVASLNKPGGNVTGVTFLTVELPGKRIDLLRQLLPLATRIAYLSVDSSVTSTAIAQQALRDTLTAGHKLGREVIVLIASSDRDFDSVFATSVERGVGALVVGAFPLFISNRIKLAALAARYRLPTIYPGREFALDGGLMSYGASVISNYRQGGVYVGKILKGAKPADLPVEQASRFELVINLKTAKALSLNVPPTILALADEVIE
jgi:putative tryptophan/tyrosine transport system substrate-binding protein